MIRLAAGDSGLLAVFEALVCFPSGLGLVLAVLAVVSGRGGDRETGFFNTGSLLACFCMSLAANVYLLIMVPLVDRWAFVEGAYRGPSSGMID